MAIVIKNADLPKSCNECPFTYEDRFGDCGCLMANVDLDKVPYGERSKECVLEEFPYEFVEKYHELMEKYPDTKMFALLPFGEIKNG